MTILVYHGKHGDEYLLADTREQREAAFRVLFQWLDDLGCYEEDDEELAARARAGDSNATMQILDRHRNGEYEGWSLVEALDPLGNDEP